MTFWFIVLFQFYCVFVLFPALHDIPHTPVARCCAENAVKYQSTNQPFKFVSYWQISIKFSK